MIICQCASYHTVDVVPALLKLSLLMNARFWARLLLIKRQHRKTGNQLSEDVAVSIHAAHAQQGDIGIGTVKQLVSKHRCPGFGAL